MLSSGKKQTYHIIRRMIFLSMMLALIACSCLYDFAGIRADEDDSSGMDSGQIAFSRAPVGARQGFYGNIVILNLDTGEESLLTDNEFSNVSPVWSPDSSQIAFTSDRDGENEVYVMDADGSNLIQLTDNSVLEFSPHWSPDGSQITFSRLEPDNEIFTINADGTDERRVTDNSINDNSPAWSPDGSQIVFTTVRNSRPAIVSINLESMEEMLLLEASEDPHSPQWSPDGNQIVFSSGANSSRTRSIHIMDVDGNNLRQLIENDSFNNSPHWSVDGSQIVFSSNRDGNSEIYIINADGSNLGRLTNTAEDEYVPVWLP